MRTRIIKHAKDNPNIWKGLAIAAAVSAAIGIGLVFFHDEKERDPKKSPAAISGRELTLSEQSKVLLRQIVNAEPLVVAAASVRASLIKNERQITFLYTENPKFQAIWGEYLAHADKIALPLFRPTVPIQNDRIANVLNGNFDCRRFSLTINYELFPAADAITPWLCTISVPPGFDRSGDFTGFLTFFLTREPSDQEKKNLALKSGVISTYIYRHDVESAPPK